MRRMRRRIPRRDAPQRAGDGRLARHRAEAQRADEHPAGVVGDEVVEAGHARRRREQHGVAVADVAPRDDDAAGGVRHQAADPPAPREHGPHDPVRGPAVHPAGHDVAEEDAAGRVERLRAGTLDEDVPLAEDLEGHGPQGSSQASTACQATEPGSTWTWWSSPERRTSAARSPPARAAST